MEYIVESLIFPAPKSGYTHSMLKGELLYIPKFKDEYMLKELAKEERWLKNQEISDAKPSGFKSTLGFG